MWMKLGKRPCRTSNGQQRKRRKRRKVVQPTQQTLPSPPAISTVSGRNPSPVILSEKFEFLASHLLLKSRPRLKLFLSGYLDDKFLKDLIDGKLNGKMIYLPKIFPGSREERNQRFNFSPIVDDPPPDCLKDINLKIVLIITEEVTSLVKSFID